MLEPSSSLEEGPCQTEDRKDDLVWKPNTELSSQISQPFASTWCKSFMPNDFIPSRMAEVYAHKLGCLVEQRSNDLNDVEVPTGLRHLQQSLNTRHRPRRTSQNCCTLDSFPWLCCVSVALHLIRCKGCVAEDRTTSTKLLELNF